MGIALALAGNAREVKSKLQAALALAETLEHPATLAFAESIGCHVLYFTRDAGAAEVFGERMARTAARYDLAVNQQIGAFSLGMAQAMRGDAAGALARMGPAFEATLGYGFLGVLPGVVMAKTLMRAGRGGEALALLMRLLGETATPEVGVFMPEVWRLRGELLQDKDAALAERCLATALRIATAQGAGLLQARAGVSLARWLAGQRRREEARRALAESGVSRLPDREAPEIAAADRLGAELAAN
jgi:hypothetical protein